MRTKSLVLNIVSLIIVFAMIGFMGLTKFIKLLK